MTGVMTPVLDKVLGAKEHNLYLSEFLDDHCHEKGRIASRVLLHGAEDTLSHSGFFTVNKLDNANMFMWYFPAEERPETAPVIFYLQGGPGLSSLVGIFSINGKFRLTKDLRIEYRDIYWSKNHHVVYIDNPVGTGFSFTSNPQGYARSSGDYTEYLQCFTEQFFDLFPHLKYNDLYIVGESYGGKFATMLASRIVHTNKVRPKKWLNFKGLIIGNGFLDPREQLVYDTTLREMGLINCHQQKMIAVKQEEIRKQIDFHYYTEAATFYNELISCDQKKETLIGKLTGYRYMYNALESVHVYEHDLLMVRFLERRHVKEAIHVDILHEYKMENPVVAYNLADDYARSVMCDIEFLLDFGCPTLLYNGMLDLFVPFIATERAILALEKYGPMYELSKRDKWHLNGTLVGYVTQVKHLQHVFIRNAGHRAGAEQRYVTWDMITKFTHKKQIPSVMDTYLD